MHTPNPTIPGIPTPDRPTAARIRDTDPPLHPPRSDTPNERPTMPRPQDDLPLALRRTPRTGKATPALTAARITLATEAEARAAGEDWATSDEPHQALTAFAYLVSLNASIDKTAKDYIPKHYGEALQRPDLWREPMETELAILEKKAHTDT
ncbi:hypothetical protein C0991_002710 [Blastosporella zonata]|nr:hypothetical protein C0991_002710 [Blastosporella zonata]